MGEGEMTQHEELALKRLAVRIVAQLPEDIAEAITVLRYSEELIAEFLAPEPAGNVVTLLDRNSP
jgi:hypothetical protein